MKCAEALAAARRVSVLVVGDICLDRWCRYEPALGEASRETGFRAARSRIRRSRPAREALSLRIWQPGRATCQRPGSDRQGRFRP